ncbi:MAG: 6-carboxytetrahydropterin synthase [Owenweeksia sp.]|nr:6-carboxytetrahydropterin synthase [Owenweeksia sp.]
MIDKLDHANLNHDVDFMQGKFTSTEVLAEEIWKVLQKPIEKHGCKLHKIRLDETVNNAVEYFGELDVG